VIRIYKDFHFDAAHWLPRVPDGHKCGRLHGHTYVLRVWCAGDLDERGFVVDYAEIADAVEHILAVLDHHLLNEIPGLSNPTTEVLATWIYDVLKIDLPQLVAIEVSESSTTGCVYEGTP
jgi:6-pyruvoyltetrahydropterin/6-carboxytetrahydropterin synthase